MHLTGQRSLTEWRPEAKVAAGFTVREVIIGNDPSQAPLEVLVLSATEADKPSREALGSFHAARLGKRVSPVVVITVHDDRAWLLGPNHQAAVIGPLARDQAERMVQAALDEPSGLAARQRLAEMYAAVADAEPDAAGNALPGVANSGLFATHEIRNGVRRRPDWGDACDTSRPLLALRKQELIERLGFITSPSSSHALVLSDGSTSRAVAVLLQDGEHFDGASNRFQVSPVAHALGVAQRNELAWVMILRGSQLRLYPARADLGVGRKGLAETYFELDLALVGDDTAGYLNLIFSAQALAPSGSIYDILAASSQYAVALGERLRTQVYELIVPRLSLAVAEQLSRLGHQMDREGLDRAYQLTLRIFFRLLFQAYAEDRKLLPYGENPRYDRNALNTYARDIVDNPVQPFDANSSSIWDDLSQVWHVIDKGDSAWSVPAYNGGLFSADPELHPEGALLERMSITNDVMGPVLRAMLLDEADGVIGPIDFRSLSVREFGTIYEGLLESNLAVADTDLVLDDKDTWVPATDDAYPLDPDRSAPAGTVYFHNTSGQRKGTGSYFTPSFVVEHLLERALDPTLAEHLARVKKLLDAGDQAGAADLFFDFRVADIAMGSGHFLTAAIDHLEAGMAAFLEENPVPGVKNELRRLDEAARKAAGPDVPEPEPSSLLRRQIARRCIYGLDINPVAVELARVSIWIHTFVRGLPMSSLDHNLVCANSLTGIGTVDEALDALVPGRNGAPTLFDQPIEDALVAARDVLVDAGMLAEVDRKETQAASRAVLAAKDAAREASLLFDAAVLARTGHEGMVAAVDPHALAELASHPHAQEEVRALNPAHLPALFPEVLLRSNAGFDVLVGNPPWEKLKVERHQWWWLRFPGLRGMSTVERTRRMGDLERTRPDLAAELAHDVQVSERARAVITSGPFPGIGAGDVDLYQAFAWRNWGMLRTGGAVGLILPRGALNGSGMTQWRQALLESGGFRDVVVLVNNRGWVFQNVHASYTAALIATTRRPKNANGTTVSFGGPFYGLAAFLEGRDRLVQVTAEEFTSWTRSAAFPFIPDAASAAIFRQMRLSPALADHEDFTFRPTSELHATQDRGVFSTDLATPDGDLPVLTGGSFNLWQPDFGPPYAWGSAPAERRIFDKVKRSSKSARSAFFGLRIDSPADLPMHSCRIAFRDVTSPTNTRTMICCLLPPDIALVHPAPYLLRLRGDECDEAFVLGVMASIVFDWYARRIVELHMTFELLTRFPVPSGPVNDSRRVRVAGIAGKLAARDERFSGWAEAVGVAVGSVTTAAEQADLEAELDALVALLYGLSRDQVEHIFATFHRGWDYQPRLDAVLRHFDAIPDNA